VANVGNGGGDKGMVYHEAKTHIPLDDKGIDEQRAMEHIQAALTEALTHPAKVAGVVFGIMMEEGAQVTVPNGAKASSLIALAGDFRWQVLLAHTLLEKLSEIQQCDEEPEGV